MVIILLLQLIQRIPERRQPTDYGGPSAFLRRTEDFSNDPHTRITAITVVYLLVSKKYSRCIFYCRFAKLRIKTYLKAVFYRSPKYCSTPALGGGVLRNTNEPGSKKNLV